MSGGVELVVAGGGTAGHLSPALAVARALGASGTAPEAIRFVGSSRGMERTLVPEAGFAVTLLPGRGFKRRVAASNLLAAFELAVATAFAAALMLRWRPGAVLAVAGYASVPCSLAARLCKVPVVVLNVDAVPGAANRLVGRFAAVSAVATETTSLPRAVVTGAPVRPEVLGVDRGSEGRARSRHALGLPEDRLVLAVVGGSLGARRINEATVGMARLLRDRSDLVLYHVSGARDHDWALAATEDLRDGLPGGAPSRLDYRLVAYEAAMWHLLAACDLLVSRAGASTLAEVTVVGVPSVLVPLPGAPGDHQASNARRLEERGAAVVIDDGDVTPERLAALASSLLDDPRRLAAMGEAARALGRPDAAQRVVELLLRSAARRRAPTEWGGVATAEGSGR